MDTLGYIRIDATTPTKIAAPVLFLGAKFVLHLTQMPDSNL
jgi:hypothetical protein